MKIFRQARAFIGRCYFDLRHPKRTVWAIKFYGVKQVILTLFTGGLLPPPLSEWAVKEGFPRKHEQSNQD